jgi:hypothetical protein
MHTAPPVVQSLVQAGISLRPCASCRLRRYAEAELAKAREAARQMMELSNQIQHMFSLCEASRRACMGASGMPNYIASREWRAVRGAKWTLLGAWLGYP